MDTLNYILFKNPVSNILISGTKSTLQYAVSWDCRTYLYNYSLISLLTGLTQCPASECILMFQEIPRSIYFVNI